jgi:hypothetical protein
MRVYYTEYMVYQIYSNKKPWLCLAGVEAAARGYHGADECKEARANNGVLTQKKNVVITTFIRG